MYCIVFYDKELNRWAFVEGLWFSFDELHNLITSPEFRKLSEVVGDSACLGLLENSVVAPPESCSLGYRMDV